MSTRPVTRSMTTVGNESHPAPESFELNRSEHSDQEQSAENVAAQVPPVQGFQTSVGGPLGLSPALEAMMLHMTKMTERLEAQNQRLDAENLRLTQELEQMRADSGGSVRRSSDGREVTATDEGLIRDPARGKEVMQEGSYVVPAPTGEQRSSSYYPTQAAVPRQAVEDNRNALGGNGVPALNPVPSVVPVNMVHNAQSLGVTWGESQGGSSGYYNRGSTVQSAVQQTTTTASAGRVASTMPNASGFQTPNVVDLTGSGGRQMNHPAVQFGQIDPSWMGGQQNIATNMYSGGQQNTVGTNVARQFNAPNWGQQNVSSNNTGWQRNAVGMNAAGQFNAPNWGQQNVPNNNAGGQGLQPAYPGEDEVQQQDGAQPGAQDPAIVGYAPPPTGQADFQQIARDQIMEAFQQMGLNVGRVSRTRYRAPYPEWIDRIHQYPRYYKAPEFTLFSGEDGASTIEHVARFTTQCGEAAPNGFLKMRLFANSLTRNAFDWYISLAPDSIHTWDQMEQAFHNQFYRCEPETTVADLANVRQGMSESVEKYMARFRVMRNKCRVTLPESECVHMLLRGMDSYVKKRLESQTFLDASHLQTHAMRVERNKQEKDRRKTASRGTYYRDQAVAFADVHSQSSDSSDDEGAVDVAVAEMTLNKPFVCPALSRARDDKQRPKKRDGEKGFEDRRKYSFDITKAEEIFDLMLKEKMITLKGDHIIPAKDEREGKKYCKWHNVWSHDTGNCVTLRRKIEDAVTTGMLKFPEGKMKIDEDPFLRMETRVADVKRVTGPRAEKPRNAPVRKLMPKDVPEPSKVRKMIVRTCPHCLKDYEEEDRNPESKTKGDVPDNNEDCERDIAVLSRPDGSEQVVVTVKFNNPALRTFKPHPSSEGKWTTQEPRRPRESVHNRITYQRPSVHDRLGPKKPMQAQKGRGGYPEGLTKTQKRRLQRLNSQARRGGGEHQEVKTVGRTKMIWVPKGEPGFRLLRRPTEPGVGGMTDASNKGKAPMIADDEPGVLDDLDDNEGDDEYLTEDIEDPSHYDETNMVFVLPEEFRAKDNQPEQLEDDVICVDDDAEGPEFVFTTDLVCATNVQETLAEDKGAIVLRRPDPSLKRHIKPLYITAHMDGVPISRVLIDGGAGMNVMPLRTMKRLRRTVDELIPKNVVMVGFTGDETEQLGVLPVQLKVGSVVREAAFFVMNINPSYAALLGRDWIHRNECIPSTLHQYLIMWKPDGEVDIVPGDEDPFEGQAYSMEARYYDGSVGPTRLEMRDAEGRPTKCLLSMKPGVARTFKEIIPGPSGIKMREPLIEELND